MNTQNTPNTVNKMSYGDFTKNGQRLIDMYTELASDGGEFTDGTSMDTNPFAMFSLRQERNKLRHVLKKHDIKTLLDYGAGGSDWNKTGFDQESNKSAVEFFNLTNAYKYEPSLGIDERQKADCVLSFDVMEHIFIADIPNVLRDIFSCANKLVVLNVACYEASALLPNGENAHITVRPIDWWNGIITAISTEYPDINVLVIGTDGWKLNESVSGWCVDNWLNSKTMVIE